jgi:hypothetical protein
MILVYINIRATGSCILSMFQYLSDEYYSGPTWYLYATHCAFIADDPILGTDEAKKIRAEIEDNIFLMQDYEVHEGLGDCIVALKNATTDVIPYFKNDTPKATKRELSKQCIEDLKAICNKAKKTQAEIAKLMNDMQDDKPSFKRCRCEDGDLDAISFRKRTITRDSTEQAESLLRIHCEDPNFIF